MYWDKIFLALDSEMQAYLKAYLKNLGNKTCLCFFIMKHLNLYWIMMTTIYLLLANKSGGQFIKAQEKLLNTRRSQPVSWAASKNIYDAPKLPFFFLDKDSICHRAIYSLRVRISMISNHSASLLSPWHHLCNTSKTDDTYIPSTSSKPMLYSADRHLSYTLMYHFLFSLNCATIILKLQFTLIFAALPVTFLSCIYTASKTGKKHIMSFQIVWMNV